MEALVNEVIPREFLTGNKIFLGERQRFDSECFVGSASSSPAPKRPNVLIRQDRVPSVTDRSVTNQEKQIFNMNPIVQFTLNLFRDDDHSDFPPFYIRFILNYIIARTPKNPNFILSICF